MIAIRVLVFGAALCGVALSLAFQAEAQVPGGETALKEGQILRGRFAQDRFLKGFDSPLKTTGSFALVPGGGLIWRAETPFAITTVMSPSGLMQEVDGKTTMSLPSQRIPFMAKLYPMLSGALTGNWSELESGFKIVRTGDARKWEMRLTPIVASDPSMPIEVIIARGGRLLEEVEVIKADGDRDHLSFSGQNLETAAPASDEAELLASARRL